jgi:hypothetical protein
VNLVGRTIWGFVEIGNGKGVKRKFWVGTYYLWGFRTVR